MSVIFIRKHVVPTVHIRACSSVAYIFREGDSVLLQPAKSDLRSLLSQPLRKRGSIPVHRGSIPHEDLIGRQPREMVACSGQYHYRLAVPTLEEYIKLTPRRVTPIYPDDANLIVSKLDLHVIAPGPDPIQERLEILEAGTGHGALSIYISRAIHAANPPTPRLKDVNHGSQSDDDREKHDDNLVTQFDRNSFPAPFPKAWRDRRGAVLHTVDISPLNSEHARKTVRGFRRGIYVGNVDFHVNDVSTWILQQQALRFNKQDTEKAFLDHILLDLPDCHQTLHHASTALKTDGKLLVFSPNITQITTCVERIKNENMPLIQDAVLEVGSAVNGGRLWEVRAFNSRTTEKSPIENTIIPEFQTLRSSTEQSSPIGNVCRPQNGPIMANGGFLGIWRKMRRDKKG